MYFYSNDLTRTSLKIHKRQNEVHSTLTSNVTAINAAATTNFKLKRKYVASAHAACCGCTKNIYKILCFINIF